MAPTNTERIEILETTVTGLIPGPELLSRMDTIAAAAAEARDTARRLEVLVTEKILPDLVEDHRTLRGYDREAGLVGNFKGIAKDVKMLRSIVLWPLVVLGPGFIGFLAWVCWGLLTHRIIIEEVVTKAAGG